LLLRLILVIAVMFLQTAKANAANLEPFIAEYEATWDAGWFPITISAKRQLTQEDNGQWKLTFEAYSSVADLSEMSYFTVANETLLPSQYRYKTSGFLSKKLRNLEIDWEKRTAFLPYLKKQADYVVPDGLQDNISYIEQMRLDLMNGKSEFNYQIAYKDRIKTYQFKVAKSFKKKTNQGEIQVVEVHQMNHKHKKEFTKVWLSQDHDYLLLKLHMRDRHGDSTEIKLEEATIGERHLSGF